jgi:excisionase family DNA binding protein
MNKNIAKNITTAQLAKALGISRIAVFKRIKNGEIKATKKGRNYVIHTSDIPSFGDILSDRDKKVIDKAINKTLHEYGETLRLLAKE